MEHRGAGRRRRGGHRARPRYGRIAALAGSLVLTVAAAGAAAGFVPYRAEDRTAGAEDPVESSARDDAELDAGSVSLSPPDTKAEPEASRREPVQRLEHGDPSEAPPHSGQGRRVVYDISDQRVWLVGGDGSVRRSYLVSGSVMDNLDPGAYDVYSRSLHAVSFDGQSTMDYMVRFTEGDNAAIGFHDIPEDLDGDPVQTVAQLGTPLSHGCIRQQPVDARAMWQFADVDTPVRVLA